MATFSHGNASNTRRQHQGIQRALIAFLAGLLMLVARPSLAQTCTLSNLQLIPQPAAISVPSSLTTGQAIFSTRVSANFSCTGSAGQGVTFTAPLQSSDGLNARVNPAVATNVSVSMAAGGTGHPFPLGPGSSTITVTSGPCNGVISTGTTQRGSIVFVGAGTCQGTTTYGLTFFATAAGAVSGKLPAVLTVSGGSYSGAGAWMNAAPCTTPVTTCNTFFGSTLLAQANLAADIPIQAATNTCTLVGPTSRTVTLPTVPVTSFKGVGTTAGGTPVQLQVNCPGAGPIALSFGLRYLGTPSGGAVTPYLTNSAPTSPASGVGIVFMNSSGAPLASGVSTLLTPSSGVNTMNIIAAYVQTSGSPSTGNVQGTATFDFTYN